MNDAFPTATLRWIDADNADSLGYDQDEYAGGCWVVEDDEGVWQGDLHGVAEDAAVTAQAMAAEKFPLVHGATWQRSPSNYGTAYELVQS